MKNLAALRRRLGVATLFNWLGPLANPAGACYQLLGVGRRDLLDLVAGALAKLGTRRALVVCSRDGLDEVSLSAPTDVREVRGGAVSACEWTPDNFGLAGCCLENLRADSIETSAATIRDVLRGTEGPALCVVLANAAAALFAAERAATLREGVALARAAILDGRALRVLEELRAISA
jgi:anthranilate phosphoribosyltransferase